MSGGDIVFYAGDYAPMVDAHITTDNLDIYGFLDPAGKKKGSDALKRVRANAAIAVIGVDHLSRVLVLEAWRGKTSAEATKQKVFELNERWRPKVFGVEANAMQELYADMLILEAQRLHVQINLQAIYQPTNVDKHWRIRSILNPIINHGRLVLQRTQYDLIRELTNFPMSPLVDLVDALASACHMIPPRKQAAIPTTTGDTATELAKHLRNQGVAPYLIEQRLAQLAATGR